MTEAKVTAVGIVIACVALFGPIVPAIYFNQPGWLFISLTTLILMLAG
jgi:hypothetical protein